MRDYNPSLPVDQLVKYRTSQPRAAPLREEGLEGRAVRQLPRRPRDPRARQPCLPRLPGEHPDDLRPLPCERRLHEGVHPRRRQDADPDGPAREVPARASTASPSSKKHDKGAPACNSCHGNHAATPPQTAYVSQVCRTCHSANGAFFDGSPHKKAFDKHGWPECATCHGNHLIVAPTDAMLAPGPKALCVDCHAKYGQPKCIETADFFYTTITGLAGDSAALGKEIDRLAERGFDVDDLRFQASSVSDAMRKTRLGIHTFDRSDFLRNSEAAGRSIAQLREGDREGLERVPLPPQRPPSRDGLHLGLRPAPLSPDPAGGPEIGTAAGSSAEAIIDN